MIKENYFTEENREEKISEWKSILSYFYSKKKGFKFTMENTALLIIDMQEYFLNPKSHAYVPSSKTIIEPILKLKQFFKENSNVIYYTQYGSESGNVIRNMMDRWWKGSLNTKDELFAISPAMEIDTKKELVVIKEGYDAFADYTNLAAILNRLGYSKLVITGVTTHLCCESTARSAFEYGFEVYLPIDCLATFNEDLHLSTLKVAAHGFGIPITSKEILESNK